MSNQLSSVPEHAVPLHVVKRAVRLSYAQAVLSAIYIALTGGMFIIGYALKLGATDAQIGLMGTIPMLAVAAQLASSILVERGVSRRSLTILGASVSVSGWFFIILLPYVTTHTTEEFRINTLVGLITLLTFFGHVATNARASWVGDLIPARTRGTFFGKMMMYGGIIGAILGLAAGKFLDSAKDMGIHGFSWLFFCGIIIGMINTMLFILQADVPLTKHESGSNPFKLMRGTFSNRSLMIVILFTLLWSMQAIAAPFVPTYLLRDLKMPFFGLALVNAMVAVTVVATGPFWGRVVDRYGCRPIIIACSSALVPVPLVWIWITNTQMAYALLCPIHLLGGFAVGGISVALVTLMYKVTPDTGRSMQLAVYSVIVTVCVAPMPMIGGHLPNWLKSLGIDADLRSTFYACMLFTAAAAIVARKIKEPDARRTRELVKRLPGHLRKPKTLETMEH